MIVRGKPRDEAAAGPGVDEEIAPAPGTTGLEITSTSVPGAPVQEVAYTLPERSTVALAVYDVAGRLVTELVSVRQKAGGYKVVWDADYVPSGVYFARLEVGGATYTRKMVLLK